MSRKELLSRVTQTNAYNLTKLPKGLLSGVRRIYLEYRLEAFETGVLEVIFENG
jgi:hypothetical protein